MKDNVSKYYNLPELWNRPPMKHQIEIAELIKSKIPSDVSSILDIGSGNGIITNQLKYSRVCAVDISEEALKYVQTEKKIGSIDQLPFKDNEFDLLLVSDVLEHLPPDIFIKGIVEMKRVAKKYILIVTPYKEKLEFGQMICVECSCQFHVNLHIRAIDKNLLESVFIPEFSIQEMVPAGEEWMHYPDFSKQYRSNFRFSNVWDLAVCPQCGTSQTGVERSENTDFHEFIIDNLHYEINKHRTTEISHNELIVLLEKKEEETFQNKNDLYLMVEYSKITSPGHIELVLDPKWNLDLTNPFTERTNTSYYSYKSYVLDTPELNISNIIQEDNVFFRIIGPKKEGTNHIIFVIPKFTNNSFDIIIEYKDTSKEELFVNVYDRGKSYIQLGKLENSADNIWKKIVITVPEDLKCSPEGFLFEIATAQEIVDFHPIKYIQVNDQIQECYNIFKESENESTCEIQYNVTNFIEQIIENNCYIKTSTKINNSYLIYHGKRVKLPYINQTQEFSIIDLSSEFLYLLFDIHPNETDSFENLKQQKVDIMKQNLIDFERSLLEIKDQYENLDLKYETLTKDHNRALVALQNMEAELEHYKKIHKEYEVLLVKIQNMTAEIDQVTSNSRMQLDQISTLNKKLSDQKLTYEAEITVLRNKISELKSRTLLHFLKIRK